MPRQRIGYALVLEVQYPRIDHEQTTPLHSIGTEYFKTKAEAEQFLNWLDRALDDDCPDHAALNQSFVFPRRVVLDAEDDWCQYKFPAFYKDFRTVFDQVVDDESPELD